MRAEQEKVAQFHEHIGVDVRTRPTPPDINLAHLRIRIMREEFDELARALELADLEGIADGAADLIYTVLGTCVSCGIDLQPIFDEVHRSNMTKGKVHPKTKKGGKGPGYQPPRIRELLFNQMTGLADATQP